MKKVIAIVLAVTILCTLLAVSVSAASYSTGSYTVSSSNGVNVRSGAGSGYSRVGAARNGVTFSVSKVSGSWGYTSSIQTTSGTKAGWVCLDYCRFNGSGGSGNPRSSYNDVFASVKGSGYQLSAARSAAAETFTKGTFVYVWGFVHDANYNLYKSYGTGTINMTLAIYRPDGSCAYSHTYNNSDNNWIGQRLDEAGTWYIQSKITGSLTGNNVQTITVKENVSASQNRTQTVTISATTLEGWSKEIKQKELGLTGFGQVVTNGSNVWVEGDMIVGREILSYKKVKVYVPPYGPDTGNSGKNVYVYLPYRIRYTVHHHEYGTKINAQYLGNFAVGLVEMKIVHTQQCSCGKSYTCTWQMPELSFNKVTAGDTYVVSSSITSK